MPDIANEASPSIQGTLNRVGMKEVELPITFKVNSSQQMMFPAKADLFVNLADPKAKGIHMSRLYQIAMSQFESETLSFQSIDQALNLFLKSHADISNEASISVSFELMTKRPSLVSKLEGWRNYPITFHATKSKEKTTFTADIEVVYSSTCPCSASLARQLIQNKFDEDFEGNEFIEKSSIHKWLGKEESILATPHSQRSTAFVKVSLENQTFDPIELIDQTENALQTSVQAMVKREDEQEFAKLNGKNLMFCEDAARKIKLSLEENQYNDYRCEVHHYESLHPHDAVAIVTKGIKGGLKV